MYIEIKEDVIKDALDKKEQEDNESLNLLLLMALCAKQSKHIVSVPCLNTSTSLNKELSLMMGESNLNALRYFRNFRYEYGAIINLLAIRCIISYKPQEKVDDHVIWVNPLEYTKFEPWIETHILTENLVDSCFYIYLAYYYANTFVFQGKAKTSVFNFNFYPLMGGGVTIDKVLQVEIERRQHFCLAIVDSDKKWGGDTGYGETAQNVKDTMERYNPFNCRYYVMQKVREIENLIPSKFVGQYGDKNGFNEIFQHDASFFDMKIGLGLGELWTQEVFEYWRNMLNDDSIFQERNSLKQQCQNKKEYDCAIKGKEPLKRGFGKNLLSLVLGDIDFSKDMKKYNPKMTHALYLVSPQDLTPAQREEWKDIGQRIFSWTCCLKRRI